MYVSYPFPPSSLTGRLRLASASISLLQDWTGDHPPATGVTSTIPDRQLVSHFALPAESPKGMPATSSGHRELAARLPNGRGDKCVRTSSGDDHGNSGGHEPQNESWCQLPNENHDQDLISFTKWRTGQLWEKKAALSTFEYSKSNHRSRERGHVPRSMFLIPERERSGSWNNLV